MCVRAFGVAVCFVDLAFVWGGPCADRQSLTIIILLKTSGCQGDVRQPEDADKAVAKAVQTFGCVFGLLPRG